MLSPDDFAARRQAVFSQMPDNSVALLAARSEKIRNGDSSYPYRQDSDFYYLTAVEEANGLALLRKQSGQTQFILFCEENDPITTQWTGARMGTAGAVAHVGADEAYPYAAIAEQLPHLLLGSTLVYYRFDQIDQIEQSGLIRQLFSAVELLKKKARAKTEYPHEFRDLSLLINPLRLIKSAGELAYLRQAAVLSANAHMLAMRACRVGMFEYELEAVLLQEFYRQGSRYPAYAAIVAAGNNACTLHYTANTAKIQDKDLLLIDAGAEFHYYAADITRTFPANGKFTAPQQAIYELVLAAQTAAIAQIAPGLAWSAAQETILTILVQGLIDLKILQGDVPTLVAEKAYAPFYMHNSGHWLGMDVHDVGDYKLAAQARQLEPGMVFTVEPGLYIAANNLKVAEQWRGIGVRIEDDIAVTSDSYEVLSHAAIKTPQAIEQWMQQK